MNTQTTPSQEATPTPDGASPSNVQSKSVAWLGVTGSTLLMLSATIFVWSGWNDFPNAVKFGIIALITALCFGTGKFLSRSLPVMGSIFTHLAIFLTPIVLLSGNMEAILPWRQFLLLEGFFCVTWFYGISQIYKSRVLEPTALLSTVLIALGLSSLEDTTLGNIPAALYIIPVVLALASLKRFSRGSLYLLVLVGVSPILTLIQPSINTGREVIAQFGFNGDVHWGYSLGVAGGLLVATIIAARIQKSMNILTLIPLTVAPYLVMSLSGAQLTFQDLIIIAPLVLLVIQASLFLAKSDSFFAQHVAGVSKGFNLFVAVIQTYAAVTIAAIYAVFLADNYRNNTAFLETKPAIGLGLLFCVGVVTYLSERNIIQEVLLGFLGFFGVGILVELTNIISHTHRETRMIIAAVVVGIASMAFRKNLLAAIIIPLSAVAVYVSVSQYSLNAERIAMLVIYVSLVLYGMLLLRRTNVALQWIASGALATWLITFGVGAVPHLLSDTAANISLYRIGFIFLAGLALTEAFELLTVGKSYIFTSDSEVDYIRPARLLMVTAYSATWFVGRGIDDLGAWSFASVVVAFGIFGAWRRRESLTMILTAPTFVVGIYAMGNYLNIEDRTIPLILVGCAGVWLFLSTYMKHAALGCYVHAGVAAFVGVTASMSYTDLFGQALFLLGLIIIAVGLIRSVTPLVVIGLLISTFGLWTTLAAQHVEIWTLYVAPVCIGLIALGMYNRNVFPSFSANNTDNAGAPRPRVSSWEAYAFPLSLYLAAAFVDSINTGLHVHSLIGGSVALVAIAIGAWRKLIAPLVIGTGFLFVFITREIFDVANIVPIWAWIGFGAFVLITIAVTLEKSQMTPTQARKKISAVVTDRFE